MKKYIFLDFDGVLNTEQYIDQLRREKAPVSDKYGYLFDPCAVDNLRKLINTTGAEIVISSSWRIDGLELMQAMWSDRELPGIIAGMTPLGEFQMEILTPDDCVGRGKEIEQWLKENGSMQDKYVILDDVPDMLSYQKPFFIQTNPIVGITDDDCLKAINILNR